MKLVSTEPDEGASFDRWLRPGEQGGAQVIDTWAIEGDLVVMHRASAESLLAEAGYRP